MDSKNPNPPPLNMSLHLPAEIIEDILSKLAVKSLLRLRCVSKSWRSLIDSKRFIKTHLEYSTSDTSFAHHRLVLGNQLQQYSIHSLLYESINDPSPLLASPESFRPASVKIVGCCNGLVCIVERRQWRFFLWNPATRITHKLPEIIENADLSGSIVYSGFGFDESTDAYKVFVNMRTRNSNESKVYSSKTNSWKTLEPYNSMISTHRNGKFVGGKLNWCRCKMGENGGSRILDIVTFDLKSEVFGEMEQPAGASSAARLGVLGGRLSVVYGRKRCVDVWVMKEYGVKESWIRVMEVPLVGVPYLNLPLPYMAPLFIGPNGEIMLIYGPYFIVYRPRKHVCLQFKKIDGVESFASPVYVESLVSPVF